MAGRKEFTGTVISDKMQKTVTVKILHLSKHPKYSKVVKKYAKFKAHDEAGIAKMGDVVRIEETRPLSKDKRFRVIEVVKRAQLKPVVLKEEV